MNKRISMVCVLSLMCSLKAFSGTSYEQTYVKKHQEIEGVAVPTEVVRPQLPNIGEDLKIDVVFTVNALGNVIDAEVVNSTDAALNKKVIKAAKQWTFRPAHIDGEPVASKVKVPFVASYALGALAMR